MRNMKKTFTVIGSFLIFAFSGIAQQAEVQIVHNSPDPAASQVDVYLGDTKLIDDFQFKTASDFKGVPTNNPAVVSIAPSNSSDTSDAFYQRTFSNLTAGAKYRLIASGVSDPSLFANNPDGKDISFDLQVNAPAISSTNTDSVNVQAFHGVPDFSGAVIKVRDGNTLGNNPISFNEFSSQFNLPASDAVLDLMDGSGNRIATFETPGFDTLGGQAGILMASGFANPSANQNGEGLTLNFVKPDGEVLELNAVEDAFIQLVHNAPDPALDSVDIIEPATGTRLNTDPFTFREATIFLPLNVNDGFILREAGTSNTLDTFNNLPIKPADTYYAVASGVSDPSQYADNPDGRDIGFEINYENARTTGYNGGSQLDFNVFHGVTDAPHVDLEDRFTQQTLVDSLGYDDFEGYQSVSVNSTYILDVKVGDLVTHTVILSSDGLNPLGGASALIFASGFNQPSNNQDGADFELMAALPNGTVDTLASNNQANVQITHNAPDPALDTVDVYLNNQPEPVLDSFPFRGSTPYIGLPANDTIEIGLAPYGSNGPGDIVASFKPRLTALETYNLMAVGVSDPSAYPANPDGINTEADLLKISSIQDILGRRSGADTSLTKLIHGVPDAPTVDVSFDPAFYQGLDFVPGLPYKESTQFTPIVAQEYNEVLFSNNASGDDLVAFSRDISNLGDTAFLNYASGFVNDTGSLPAVELVTVLPGGNSFTWNKESIGFEEQSAAGNFGLGVYPNPVVDETQVSYSIDQRKDVSMSIINNNGQVVKELEIGEKGEGAHHKVIDLSSLNSGLYHLQLKAGEEANNAKLLVK